MRDQPSTPVPGRPSPRLLVFLHVALKQRAFQSELQGALGALAVTAVGRTADFDRALDERPDAVLTVPLVLAAHGLPIALQGLRRGAPEDRGRQPRLGQRGEAPGVVFRPGLVAPATAVVEVEEDQLLHQGGVFLP